MECLLFLSQITSPPSSVSCLTWKTEMRSRKATLGLLTKIPVEKLLWGMSTTRKEEKQNREAASGHPGKESPALVSLICCPLSQRTQNSPSCIWRTSHWHQVCASRRLTAIPKVGTGEVKEWFIMPKGKNAACIWLEASTVLSITLVTVREQMTLMESQTGDGFLFFWIVCLWLWTDLKIHVKHKTSE